MIVIAENALSLKYRFWLAVKVSISEQWFLLNTDFFACSFFFKQHKRTMLEVSLTTFIMVYLLCDFSTTQQNAIVTKPCYLQTCWLRFLNEPKVHYPTLSLCCYFNGFPYTWTDRKMSHLWTKDCFHGWGTLSSLEKMLQSFWLGWKKSMEISLR